MHGGLVRGAFRTHRGFAVLDDAVRWTRRIATFDIRARGGATSTDVRRANVPLPPIDRSQILLGGSLREGPTHRSLCGGDSCLFRNGSVTAIRGARRKDYFGRAVRVDDADHRISLHRGCAVLSVLWESRPWAPPRMGVMNEWRRCRPRERK